MRKFFGNIHFAIFLLIVFEIVLEWTAAGPENHDHGVGKKYYENCGRLDYLSTDIRALAPWASVIYRLHRKADTKTKVWEFHTNGTLIAPDLVFSFHAGPVGRFASDKNPRNFFVAAGVNSSSFEDHDEFSQYSRVSFIQPFEGLSVDSNFLHGVIYHLETPLNFSTPFVRAICLPLFWADPRAGFTSNHLPNTLFPLIQFGFARITTSSLPSRSKNNEPESVKWFLQVWKSKALDQKICDSLLRFYYENTTSTICFTRNLKETNLGQYSPSTQVLKRLGQQHQNSSVSDLGFCHGHGSGVSIGLGKIQYFLGAVCLIPAMKRRGCNEKTVYFMALSRDPKAAVKTLQWFRNLILCGGNSFSCSTELNNPFCIPISKTCDDVQHCEDGSDEHFGMCPSKEKTSVSKVEGNRPYLSLKCPSLELEPQFPVNKTKCTDLITGKRVDCSSEYSFAGTELKIECDEFHKPAESSYQFLQVSCNAGGNWDGIRAFRCEKECGIYVNVKDEEKLIEKENEYSYPYFPWDVSIFDRGNEICRGTLIERNFVITNSVCLKEWIKTPNPRKKSNFQIGIRPVSLEFSKNFDEPISTSQRVSIKNVWTSNSKAEGTGIALLKLESSIDINGKNKPTTACYLIPPFEQVAAGKIGWISNGDKTDAKEHDSNSILPLVVTSRENCNQNQTKTIFFGPPQLSIGENVNNFCAISHSRLKGHDSVITFPHDTNTILPGTGLVFKMGETWEKSRYILKGISSGSLDDGTNIFIDLDSAREWMLDILEKYS